MKGAVATEQEAKDNKKKMKKEAESESKGTCNSSTETNK